MLKDLGLTIILVIQKTQYKMLVQWNYLIYHLIFSTQNWLKIEILELQKEMVEWTKLTNIRLDKSLYLFLVLLIFKTFS